MGVNHGGRYVAVVQQLLHRADVGARLQKVGGCARPWGIFAPAHAGFQRRRVAPGDQPPIGHAKPTTAIARRVPANAAS